MFLQLQKNERLKTQHCDNSRDSNACRWRRLCQMRWSIRRQCLLFIELIQPRTENETEGESDHENGNENENDENEDKQYLNRLSRDTKTDDAKCKNDVNRLHFMKLKSWKVEKKKLFFRKEKFFRDADSLSTIACSDQSKRKISYLIRLANVNVTEDDVNVTEDDVNVTVWMSIYQDPK
jgi:hypothetical protein